MGVDYTSDLPQGIDFYNQNWANNRDLNKIDAFKGQGGSLVAVNDGTGHFMYLPIQYVQAEQHQQGATPSQGGHHNPLSGLFGGGAYTTGTTSPTAGSAPQGAYLNTVHGDQPGGFADYLAQIGANPNTPAQAAPSNPFDAVMAGFGFGGGGGGVGPWWMRALRARGASPFAQVGGLPGGAPPSPATSNLYQQFLQYTAAHPAPNAPIPAQTQPVGYQF